ncbi:Response regulator receiver domain-containing protein [Reichenbachiella faecimaris]|uniref:Response regulator receiver domain-containing protein n=1 Tax=Reichenbachiella faecimaris TaxID=692418 RepID=A0A1W2G8L8_REIFA|nr:PglZ domain-containing protein [Reichenbachiella faecimaris]SMD33017.1 Response regulator receiver domain-containing protein [Reichenbachiella faecimaris]
MRNYEILWADDEIDLLKPHILFLNNKGYNVTGVNSGSDALDEMKKSVFDVVFLDENMPGLTGLETLAEIKTHHPNVPVVMITKSEEEHIMEEAIGAKIADYLIKPLNPNQILLSVKKILDNKRLVTEKTNMSYQQDFRNISSAVNENLDFQEWIDVYKKMVYWELEIDDTEERAMAEVLNMQKDEANSEFCDFITANYASWLNDPNGEKPLLSHRIMREQVFPLLEEKKPVFFFLIDNLRYDQWEILEPIISEYYNVEKEVPFYATLPTTTAYSRNSIFSGMLPDEMAKKHSDIWISEDGEEGKNMQEEEFLRRNLKRNNHDISFSYHKILQKQQGRQLVTNINNLLNNDLNAVVYNFIDVLSHARTDMKMIRELAPDEPAYRSLTLSWFKHSTLLELLQILSQKDVKVIITTDHGTIRVKRPYKIVGDKKTNTNLRYKVGKNLNVDNTEGVFICRNPEELHLPKENVSSSYIFGMKDDFFVYPNNYNHFVNYYKDTFQHGGISMEEMIVPLIHLTPKS